MLGPGGRTYSTSSRGFLSPQTASGVNAALMHVNA